MTTAMPANRSRLALAALLLLLVAPLANARVAAIAPGLQLRVVDHAVAGAPANVPDGYVITPNGYFHRSCVHHIGVGAVLNVATGAIQSGGNTVVAADACRYPHFTPEGVRVDTPLSAMLHPVTLAVTSAPNDGVEMATDTIFGNSFGVYHGWIEAASSYVGLTYSLKSLNSDWTVPAEPTSQNPVTTIYFFPGAQAPYQPNATHGTIIQPVLGWNAAGDMGWTVSSWNCCVDGNVNASSLVSVDVGDAIKGTMVGGNCSATTGICPTWTITTRDVTSGQQASLTTTAYGQAFNWIFAGVLEVYGVSICDDLPPTGYLDFNHIVTVDVENVGVGYGFQPSTRFTSSVWCGYHVQQLQQYSDYRLHF